MGDVGSRGEGDSAAYERWRGAVRAVLAKRPGVDAEQVVSEPERLLTRTTYDGVEIAPLYTAREEQSAQPLPGFFPFVRGHGVAGSREGWLVGECFGGDGAAVNAGIVEGLNAGVSLVWVRVGAGGLACEELPKALEGVLFDAAALGLEAGEQVGEATQRMVELFDHYGARRPEQIVLGCGAAPLTSQFAGTADVSLAAAVDLARQTSQRPENIRALRVDGTVFHNAGASDAQELGAAVAAGVEYVRALTSVVSPQAALRQVEFRCAATDEQFATIAKFRAARLLWARVAQVCGHPQQDQAPLHAVTSVPMMTHYDVWVNLPRTTVAAFGAGIGGADSVTVLPFDSALPAGELGVPPEFSRRMARNIGSILLEEARLGFVNDPAAGSWYVEKLTKDLAERSWEFFRSLEKAGGYSAALDSGLLTDAIAETREQRASDIAHRKKSITGINEFPNPDEPPLSHAATAGSRKSYAGDFEELRSRSDDYMARIGHRPQVLVVRSGNRAQYRERLSFLSNMLLSGGFSENVADAGQVDLVSSIRDSGIRAAVLCGADSSYATAAEDVRELRTAGISRILVVAPRHALAEFSSEDRPDGCLEPGMDVLAALRELWEVYQP